MSMIKDVNWEKLSKEHEQFMQDPGYLLWVAYQKEQSVLTKEEEKQWDIIVQKEAAMHLQ